PGQDVPLRLAGRVGSQPGPSDIVMSRAHRGALTRRRRRFMSNIDEAFGAADRSPSLRELLAATPLSDALTHAIDACAGGWAIDAALARVLVNAVILGAGSVLEFGAGMSSVVLATALDAAGGGKLTSVEQDPSWCAEEWAAVQLFDKVDAQLVVSSPTDRIGRLGVYA